MTDYVKLADLAARAVWDAASEEDPDLKPWADNHESTREIAREDMGELARIVYPVFAAQALRDAEVMLCMRMAASRERGEARVLLTERANELDPQED